MDGTRLGAYRILSSLGRGVRERVYLAEVAEPAAGLAPGTRVALKVVHPHLLETSGFRTRLLREAEIGRSVRHPNVVRCFDGDAALVDGVPQDFLVMEYVEGQTLRALLDELGRVPEDLCRHVGREVAKGLRAIHEAGVVHRDLKPDNVLITHDHVVKVMDLGVARLQDEAIRLSRTGAFVGSLEYAAPEQLGAAGGSVDPRTDLHALGAILYELATGVSPFRADDARAVIRGVLDVVPRPAGELNPQVSPLFEAVVRTLLAKEQDGRFRSAADVVAVLAEGEKSAWWAGRARARGADAPRSVRRMRIPRETSLCGREAELGRLEEIYDRVRAGSGQVVLVDGEAGIGKTRLVDDFVGRLVARGEDLNFLFGAYPPGGAATGTGAFTAAYRRHFGTEDLESAVRPYLAATPRLVPAFASVLKGEVMPDGGVPLTKDSLQTVFVHVTRALARERPTVVLVDDLHFAPQAGRALFASLALAVPEHPILLVGTLRRGTSEAWVASIERLEHAGRLVLSRLGPKDLFRLLKEAFRSEDLANALSGKIAVKSDGNPYFAFEIIRELREEGLIEQRPDGEWVSTSTIRDVQVPSAVLDLIRVRLGGLEEEDQDLLDVAACCGYEFDPLLVGEVVGLDAIPTLKRLARLEARKRIVCSVENRFVFDHHQIQEAVYASMPEPLAREYHARIAAVLEARAGAAERDPRELPGATCLAICHHRLRGAAGTETDRYLDAALDHLERLYLHDEAASLAERALAVPELLTGARRVGVLLRSASALEALGRREEERAAAEEAVEIADGLPDAEVRARAHRLLGHSLERSFANEEALAELERALALAKRAEAPGVEGAAHTCLGHVCQFLGRWDEAEAHHLRARDLARASGDVRTEAGATLNLGYVLGNAGRPADAKPHFAEALALAQRCGARQIQVVATGNLGTAASMEGRWGEAAPHFEQALALAREIGDRGGEALAHANEGIMAARLGRWAEALGSLQRAVATAREVAFAQLEAESVRSLADVQRNLGRPEEARALLERCLETARRIGDRRLEARVLVEAAAVRDEQGAGEDAAEVLAQGLELARELSFDRVVAKGLLLAAARAPAEEAAGLLGEAVEKARAADDLATEVLARCRLAVLSPERRAEAIESLERAGRRLDLATRLEANYRVWQATGRAAFLAEAKEALAYAVAHAPPADRASLQTSVPVHREVAAARADGDPGLTPGESSP